MSINPKQKQVEKPRKAKQLLNEHETLRSRRFSGKQISEKKHFNYDRIKHTQRIEEENQRCLQDVVIHYNRSLFLEENFLSFKSSIS